jgi:hypothetical protein
MQAFIASLDLPADARARLAQLHARDATSAWPSGSRRTFDRHARRWRDADAGQHRRPEIATAERFYGEAFGLHRGRRFGSDALELLGADVPIYLLHKQAPARSVPAPPPRDYLRHWTPCMSMSSSMTSTRP